MSEKKVRFPYRHFTTKEIRPCGWLRCQLQVQAEGLAGNLDRIWPDVRNSKWIGGDREGWERVPYWLDGFIPLAWLLDDDDMKARASRYIDAVLAGQKEDGWICPCRDDERKGYDVWAVFLICKVLVTYYECTGDSRIEDAVRAALQNLHRWLFKSTLFNWGAARWYECMISINWLYDRNPEPWLEELAHALAVQGTNYRLLMKNFTDTGFKREWKQTSHVVNLAMALKAYAVSARFVDSDGENFAEEFLSLLQKHHGTAFGLFTGDECLAGSSPVQGTELCAIVEAMYSFEVLFETTGDPVWLDRLEKLAFNALPATVSEDMWTHQYVQQVNQISCCIQDGGAAPVYTTNSHEANIFGLEPHYGCCTANMGQGFPKFALSTFYRCDTGICAAAIAPSVLNVEVGGAAAKIRCETDYPFGDKVRYFIRCNKPAEFSFFVRVPSSSDGAMINGENFGPGQLVPLRRVWCDDCVEMEISMKARLIKHPDGLYTAERGNVLYSLPIGFETRSREYEREGVERRFPYCDYEFFPVSPWNYGFASDELSWEQRALSEKPFSTTQPPAVIMACMDRVEWHCRADQPSVCEDYPTGDTGEGERIEKELYPYGCTKLRMTEMPLLKEGRRKDTR